MCLSYLFVLSPFLFSCKNVFSVREEERGRFTSGTSFFDLLLLFLKNALLPLLFHSKMSFTGKNPDFFPRSPKLNKLTNDFFQGARCKTSNFLVLTPKGSLFSLYYCHSYYPAYSVWDLFLTTHCDHFVLGKALLSLLFIHQLSLLFHYSSQIFIATFPYFFVERHLKALGAKK